MRVITPLDLRRSLGRILDEASAGQRFLIARDHRPMAVLVPVEEGRRLEDDVEARIARMEAAFERLVTLPLFAAMTDADVDDVLTALNKVLGYYAR